MRVDPMEVTERSLYATMQLRRRRDTAREDTSVRAHAVARLPRQRLPQAGRDRDATRGSINGENPLLFYNLSLVYSLNLYVDSSLNLCRATRSTSPSS